MSASNHYSSAGIIQRLLWLTLVVTGVTPVSAQDEPTSSTSPGDTPLVIDMRSEARSNSAEVAPPEPSMLIEYRETIAEIESSYGAYAPDLSQHLLGYGTVLQQLGRHEEAISALKRAVHLARINGGLYSAEQIAMLRSEIRSHSALGDYETVDEKQRYLYRVERRALADSPRSSEALMNQARWQRDAFLLGVGDAESLATRPVVMWDLYRLALTEIVNRDGNKATSLVEPLLGMLQSQYLVAGVKSYKDMGPGPSTNDDVIILNGLTFDRGEKVLTAIKEINELQYPGDRVRKAEDLIQLGDWSWFFGDRRDGMALYQQALAELAPEPPDAAIGDAEGTEDTEDTEGDVSSEPNGSDSVEDERAEAAETAPVEPISDALDAFYRARASGLFADPVPLPDVEGIKPIPPRIVPDDDPEVLVISFTVTASGRAVDVERIQEPDVEDKKRIVRLSRLIRDTRFRPRIVDGEAVETTGIIWAFGPSIWAPTEIAMN